MFKKVAAIFLAVVISSFIFVSPASSAEVRRVAERDCYGSDCVSVRAEWHRQRDGKGLVVTKVVVRATGDLERDHPYGVRHPRIEILNPNYIGERFTPKTLGSDNVWKRHKNTRFGKARCALVWFEGVLRRDNDNDESFIVTDTFCY